MKIYILLELIRENKMGEVEFELRTDKFIEENRLNNR